MAKKKASFERRQREKAKKERADDKRRRRHSRSDSEEPDVEPPAVDEADVIRQLEELNTSYDRGDVEFEEFDQRRTALLDSLTIN